MNGDGGSWIKEPYDPEVIFRLDRYHICQEILRKIGDKEGVALTPAQKVAVEAVQRIDAMYHLDNSYKELPAEEILDNRQLSVKPLVDAYFA